MRVVFVNLHSDWMLVKTMSVKIFKQSAAIKHGYLLNYLLNNPEYEVCSYINDRGFSLMKNGNEALLKFLNKFKYIEHNSVLKENGINKKKITVIKNINDIKPDDIVIMYVAHKDNFIGMENADGFKVVSFLHFHGMSGEDQIIKDAHVNCLINESDLSKNSQIFKNYYDLNQPWIVHPFVYGERFKPIKPFNERKNMAFATGTITYMDHKEFLDTYGDPCDQPSRKQIKDNPEFFKDTVYCTSSDYLEDQEAYVPTKWDSVPVIGLIRKIYRRFHTGQQKKYFSFDMVEAFNDYKMCIVGEEIVGIPGIGGIEGMASGCAYIGLDSPMYTDWGFVPGKHYITYDGTKEDLKRVIEYYQMDEHQEELEQIAKAGCEFVRENFVGEVVAKRLIEDLVAEQKKWLEAKQSN